MNLLLVNMSIIVLRFSYVCTFGINFFKRKYGHNSSYRVGIPIYIISLIYFSYIFLVCLLEKFNDLIIYLITKDG